VVDHAVMEQSAALRHAREAAARRDRLRTTGRPGTALIVAARPTGVLDGMAAVVEFELELAGMGEEPSRRVKVVEPVPLVLASRALAGMSINVIAGGGGDLLIEWST
jgi:hypothetical protein